jgi:hypothetical protein
MSRRRLKSGTFRPRESGYALLMVLFMIMVMIAGSLVLIEKLAIQGVRAREAEAVWRGTQYTRAIRLFYHKMGRYPQTMDDLSKGLPQLHFLRQAYKNPVNKDDGTWRLIYVNAAGQIIGSTRYANLQQMALIDSGALAPGTQPGQQPGQPGIPAASLADTSNSSGSQPVPTPPSSNPPPDNSSSSALNSPPNSSASNGETPPQAPQGQPNPSNPSAFGPSNTFGQPSGQPGQPGQFGQMGQGNQSLQIGSVQALLQLKPTGAVDGPVLGAFLTGVGGKGEQPSLRVYHGAKKYKDWEFIWNPLEDAASALQQGSAGQGLQPGQPGLPTGLLGSVPLGSTTSQPAPSQPQQQQPQQPQQQIQPLTQ